MDPDFDRSPNDKYRCEICHTRGDHFKSLCPKNGDPYSIIQKRKARGIKTPTSKKTKSRILENRDIVSDTLRDSESLCSRVISRAESSYGLSSISPPYSYSPTPSGRKLEILQSLQNVEDSKQRLFREQSDELVGMIQETTIKRSGNTKRARSGDGSRSSGTDSPADSAYARKTRKTDSQGMGTIPKEDLDMAGMMVRAFRKRDQDCESDDTSMTSEEHVDTNGHYAADSTSRKPTFTLRPNENSSESVDLYESEGDNSDEMYKDGLNMKPIMKYSPLVQYLVQRRPETREVVNHVGKRKTAQDMWKQTDLERAKRAKAMRDT
ncbi:hypothetical protein JHW43_004227 [Diplocarpon mali]|nr:hypothetical protein JHW43_004227 [Diplocarpon mali]